jgi:hypothetical protein
VDRASLLTGELVRKRKDQTDRITLFVETSRGEGSAAGGWWKILNQESLTLYGLDLRRSLQLVVYTVYLCHPM